MKPKTGIALVITALLLTQANQVWVLITRTQSRSISAFIITAMFVLIAVMLFIERERLDDFGIDRFTLILFIIPCFIRMRFQVVGEERFAVIIGLAGLICSFVLIRHWQSIRKTDLRWVGIALVVGCVMAIIAAQIEIWSDYLSLFEYRKVNAPFFLILGNRILYALSFTTPVEELLIRGFLWGYLLKIWLE